MKVFVYFNIRTKVWSIKALKGPNKGRVVAHRKCLYLQDCTFKVSEAGRQRVLRKKCKNVHAGVVGNWGEKNTADRLSVFAIENIVSYNPYKNSSFVIRGTDTPIYNAKAVLFDGTDVFAY